jgi:Zinc-finger of C2H2 type
LQQQKLELEQRKKDTIQARESWRVQAEQEMVLAEVEDRLAGRLRLADLEDDYDYGGKKGKKKKPKKKKNILETKDGNGDDDKDVNDNDNGDSNNEEQETSLTDEQDGLAEEGDDNTENATDSKSNDQKDDDADPLSDNDSSSIEKSDAQQVPVAAVNEAESEQLNKQESSSEEEEEEEEEDEPDFWHCECCRKDFKSEGQLQNHMKSKKHKEAFKRFEKKLAELQHEMDVVADE